jgi:hypothetical protein
MKQTELITKWAVIREFVVYQGPEPLPAEEGEDATWTAGRPRGRGCDRMTRRAGERGPVREDLGLP